MMKRTKRFRINPTEELKRLCRVSNDLYNQSIYHWRQRYEQDGEYLKFYDLRDEMRDVPNLEGEKNFRLMKSHAAEFTVKQAWSDIDNFYKAMKKWKAHPELFKAKPEFPRYHKRGGMTELYLDTAVFAIKDGQVVYDKTKGYGIPIPQYDYWQERFKKAKMVRFLPRQGKWVMEVVYEIEPKPADVTENRVAAIDLGVDNLATMVTPEGCIIYSGKPLKAYNQFFNKQLAKARSILALQNPDTKRLSSKRIRNLYDKRDRYIDTYMHTVSKRIVDELTRQGVGLLVVGRNKGWKQEADMSKIQNQKFVQIPYFKLQGQLQYKCETVGIRYAEQEEGHTSKCDALALEPIEHHEKYLGTRKTRGLFKSSTGTVINADQNGALNILRKHIGDDQYLRLTADWHLKSAPRVEHVFCKS